MAEFNASVTIERPVDAVFAYVGKFERWPEWRLALTSARRITPGPTGAGSRAAVTGQMMGRSVEMEVEVTAYAPGERIGFKTGGHVEAEGEFRFESAGTGTRVSVVGTATPPAALKIAGPLIARQANEMWANDLAALKGILED